MINSKLIRVLKTFSKSEFKEFEKFVTSSYFAEGRIFFNLLNELKKYYPDFNSQKLTREKIYSALYPGKEFKDSVIFTITSGLYNLAKEFLVQEHLKQNDDIKQPLLMREFSRKGLKSEVENMINKFDRNYSNKEKCFQDYYKYYKIYEEVYDHYFFNGEKTKLGSARERFNLLALKNLLLELIITEKETRAQRNFLKQDFYKGTLGKALSYINFEKIISELEKEDPENTVILSIYYNILISLKHLNDDTHYFRTKLLIEHYYIKMDYDLKRNCYINLENICTDKVLNGKYEWYIELFNIHEKILKDKLYIPAAGRGSFFENELFRNILVVSMILKKYEWAEKFVIEYIDDTNPLFKTNLLNTSLALIEFNKKNYDKALYHTGKIEQKNFINKLDTRNLLAKIYYETNSDEPLFSLFDSYNHLLKNTKVNDKTFVYRHLNFIKYLTKIVKLKLGDSENIDLYKIKSTLNKTKYVNNKTWLNEKIDELMNP